MCFKKLLVTALSFLILVAFCMGEDRELIEINRVVARVNDRIITWGEVERKMDRLNFSDEEKNKRAVDFVEGEIDRYLSIDAFNELGMLIPESYIEQEYNKKLLEDFNGDRRLFRDILQSNGQSQLEFREQIKENIIHMHMLAKRKRSREEISPERVEVFYRENPQMFVSEREIRLAEILITPESQEDTEETLKSTAYTLHKKILNGADFSSVANENGSSFFRSKGGDWGVMVKKEEIRNPVVRDRVFLLKKGEISDPFPVKLMAKNNDGTTIQTDKTAYYIFKVLDEKAGGLQSLSEARSQIERLLAAETEAKEQQRWLNRKKRDAYVLISLPDG